MNVSNNVTHDNISWDKIESSVLSVTEFANFSSLDQRKVAIFCGYIKCTEEFNYHDRIYQWLKANGYYVILVMPNTASIDNSELAKACDVFIERENFGYDFGSYACGLQYMNSIRESDEITRLLFVNDSFIGPFGHCMPIDDTGEFWGNTDSNQVKYHYQSYLFGFNLEKTKLSVVNSFFFERGDIYTNDKDKVIHNFELSLFEYFYSQGLDCQVQYPVSTLRIDFLKRPFSFISYRQIFSRVFFYLRVLRQDVNPTHQLWYQLFSRGFPFLKKELLRDNPTDFPDLRKKVDHVIASPDLIKDYREIVKCHL